MYTSNEILKILYDEFEYTERHLKRVGGRYNGNPCYEVVSSSNECLELLLGTIECESEKDIQEDIYVLSVTFENEIVMTIGCYPNKMHKFQLNNFITKYTSNTNCPKNVAMCLHSYSASLFGSKYIVIKEPLEHMKNILLQHIPNVAIINTDNYNNIKEYELQHEKIIGCPYATISYHGIGNYGESIIIEITDELKHLYLTRPDLTFSYTKITGNKKID